MLSEKDSVGEDFFSVSKNLIIDERLKGNLFAFGELITIEEDILNDAKIIADKVVLSSSIYGSPNANRLPFSLSSIIKFLLTEKKSSPTESFHLTLIYPLSHNGHFLC